MVDIIYHYTNAQGILGILNKQEETMNLWFTHYKYLNDSSEGSELQRIFGIVINGMKEKNEITETEYDCIKDLQFEDKHMYAYTTKKEGEEPLTYIKNAEDDAYICCFSKNGDSLNMWRYYSKQDTGYSLGFLKHVLERETRIECFLPEEKRIGKAAWEDVIYDDNAKMKKVSDSIINAREETKKLELPSQKDKRLSYTNVLREAVKTALIPYKFTFKHVCFQSEEEIRCILTIPKDKHLTVDKTPFTVLYRNRNGIITPYISVPFPRKALHSIIISPTAPAEAQETMIEYLRDYRDNVSVMKSELPIRF